MLHIVTTKTYIRIYKLCETRRYKSSELGKMAGGPVSNYTDYVTQIQPCIVAHPITLLNLVYSYY